MAWVYCGSCEQKHNRITQADAFLLLTAFMRGDAQVVTAWGVETLCILDILKKANHRKVRDSERQIRATRVLPDLLAAG